MFTEEQKKALAAPLDPRHVKPPPQGKYGEYIEGFHVLYEANRIFGFDGWSSSVQQITLTNEEQQGEKWRIGYMAVVNISAGGQTRCGVGHGQGFGKSLGDAHDSAVKEAETDAIKRALRTFGNPFGLALYDKTKANVQAPPQELPTGPITDTTRDWIQAQLTKHGKQVGQLCAALDVTSLKALTYEQMDEVKGWLKQPIKENA